MGGTLDAINRIAGSDIYAEEPNGLQADVLERFEGLCGTGSQSVHHLPLRYLFARCWEVVLPCMANKALPILLPTVGSSIDHWSSIVVSGIDEHLFGDERIPACFVRFHLKLGAVATDC